ncbi:HAD family hydrolase, partial [Escherichia coli]|nr:HAD family hydrolase [Escherichia coli]
GQHALTGVAATTGTTERDVLAIAAAVEADSEHPQARAIVSAADQSGRRTASEFRPMTGRGVRADVDGVTYAVGGPALLRELDVTVPDDLEGHRQVWSRRGAAVLSLLRLGDDAVVLGALALADEVRPEAR